MNIVPSVLPTILIPLLLLSFSYDSSAKNYTTGTMPLSVISSDFNNDGLMDLATANYSSNDISVLLNNGVGDFATAVNYYSGRNPACIISADFNGDGNADLAVANYSELS